MRKLQDVLDDIPFENLPAAWTTFDLAAFSRSKPVVGLPAEREDRGLPELRRQWTYKYLYLDSSNTLRTFSYNGLQAQIFLFLYAKDANQAPQEYRECWVDSPAAILDQLCQTEPVYSRPPPGDQT